KDVFFNETEGQTPNGAAGTTVNDQTVSVNLAGLTPGSDAKLVLRLVNNDGDTQTSVHIANVQVVATPAAEPPSASVARPAARNRRQIDFGHLADVSPSFLPVYGKTSFDEASQVLHAGLALRNAGSYAVHTSLLVAVRNLSDPALRIREEDGV